MQTIAQKRNRGKGSNTNKMSQLLGVTFKLSEKGRVKSFMVSAIAIKKALNITRILNAERLYMYSLYYIFTQKVSEHLKHEK